MSLYFHIFVDIYGLSYFGFVQNLMLFFFKWHCSSEDIWQPQDHWLFVLLSTIRWPREVLFEQSTSTAVLRQRSLQLNSYWGCILIIIYRNRLFSRHPIKWQNFPVPSRVTSWNRSPSRAGSQVALGMRLHTSSFVFLVSFITLQIAVF